MLVASLLSIGGCGSVSHGSVSPTARAGLALTDTDAGKTFQLRSGRVVLVTLHQVSGYTAWSDLHSTDTAVLAPRVDTRKLAVRGVTLGSFGATAAGKAQLQATSSVSCPKLEVCPALARAWTVTIQVT